MTSPSGPSGSRALPQDSLVLAPAVCCCGFLTFVPFLVMGVRADRRAWKIAAAVYGAFTVVGVLLMTIFASGTTQEPLGEPGAQSLAESTSRSLGENLGVGVLIAVWIAGVIHAFILREEWRKLQTGHGPGPVWQNGPSDSSPMPPTLADGRPGPAQNVPLAPTARQEFPPFPPPIPRPPADRTTHQDLQAENPTVAWSDQQTGAEPQGSAAEPRHRTDTDRTTDGEVLPAPDPRDVSSKTRSRNYGVGDTIGGRFEVEKVLGSGGFSKVYRVRDVVEGEERALKLFDDAAGYDAVRREIGALRKVHHPNVVKVIWADKTDQGEWYLIMEYVEGELLADYAVGRKQLRDREAIDVALEILSVLVAIHPDGERLDALDQKRQDGEITAEEFDEWNSLSENALVHRDIKPQNIILTRSGAKLLDFNIASRVGDPVRTVSGTPPYQPPGADLTRWDVSTDLFAVGVTLFELLCDGEHPYPQARPTLDVEPRDPRQFRSDLSEALAEFLMRACATDSSTRFQTAVAMMTALETARASL